MASESVGKELNSRPVGQAASSSVNDLDMGGSLGADLLSESVSIRSQLPNSYQERAPF